MEEIVNKFIEEGKREHEEIDAFIKEFRTTNELLLKERNNSLSELEFEVYGLSRESTNNQARLKEACTVTMNERCVAVLLNKLQSKEKDPGSFTIPCDIGHLHIDNALADLGASISLMPYTMYEKLDLGELKQTRMSLELADRSIQYPRGIAEDVLIKIDKFVLPINFVILDMREDSRFLIISGRLFLATARATIDVFNKKITLRVGSEEITIRRIDHINTPYTQETQKYEETQNEHLYSASAIEIDKKRPELKDLPSHLEYAYLKGDESCPVIILSKLTEKEKISLLRVLERRKGAIAWKIRLNPKVQDVVKDEIVRLLDSGLIYPISDSPWEDAVRIMQCSGNFLKMHDDKMLGRCEETNLVLNWEKCHFMVKEGIVLGHKISGKGIEVDKAKIDVCSFMLCDLDFEPLSLSLSSMPSCDLVSLTNILILCLILKASNQS
ncbi:DNA-directed DNA polymerase [Tanacetum coccineum]